jgi:hypothetical protein
LKLREKFKFTKNNKYKNMKRQEFEINPLTYIPGGSFITIEFSNGTSSKGVNVKSPKKYIETVITESLLKGLEVTKAYFTGGGNDTIYENGKFFNLSSK